LDTTNDLIWLPSQNVSREQRLQEKDIAVCMSSGSPSVVGKTAQLEEPFEGSVGAFCGIIRTRSVEHADYLAYWLRSPYYEGWRDSQTRGSNIQNLRFSEFASILLPLPPPSELKRIVAILKEQMKAVEQARAAAEAQLNAAKDLPAAYLHAVFESQQLQQWSRVKLGDLLNLRKEIIHPRDNPKGTAIFVGLEHIKSLTGRRIGSVELKKSNLTGRKPQFYKGDIVYGYLRPYLNKVWIAEFDGLCSVDQYVYSVETSKAISDFVAWFMRSSTYLDRAPIDTTPGQLPRIRTEEVARVEINLPSLAEQERIVSAITKEMTTAQQVSKHLQDQFETINKLPAALLRQAFIGKL
jgi:restriction endonuclease S subunit